MSAQVIDFNSIQPKGFYALSARNQREIIVYMATMIMTTPEKYSFEMIRSFLDEEDQTTIDRKINNLLIKQKET
jgi:intein-encoded DNA endonuclease-like protein